jgi:hypothetical protein
MSEPSAKTPMDRLRAISPEGAKTYMEQRKAIAADALAWLEETRK